MDEDVYGDDELEEDEETTLSESVLDDDLGPVEGVDEEEDEEDDEDEDLDEEGAD